MMNQKLRHLLFGSLCILFGLVIDQVTKALAFTHFRLTTTYPCLPGLFIFSLVKNTGAAWGIFSDQRIFFIIITLVALGFMAYLGKDFNLKTKPIFSAAWILIITGTIGNFIDRLLIGYVRDFVTFAFIDFPSFNFADMCLTVGVTALAVDILFGETGKRWNR